MDKLHVIRKTLTLLMNINSELVKLLSEIFQDNYEVSLKYGDRLSAMIEKNIKSLTLMRMILGEYADFDS